MSTPKNPWTTLSSKSVYSNPWIEVEESQVITPAGKPGIYGKVHFKNTAVEKNGEYLYITKDNCRTNVKVKITKDTQDIKDPVDLFEYYIRYVTN